MSADAMDIDPVSQSPERKRKNKEKDHHSSKKRKHLESSSAPAETSSKGKKKEKSKKHKHPEAPEPASTLPDTPNARSKTKQHKTPHAHAHDSDNETTTQSPSVSRKPLTKSSTTAQSSQTSSPFHLITSTLYVPLSPISISPTQALPSLLAEHLSPLLLTYYPPFHGIVLAYSNASISSTPPRGSQTHPDRPNTNPQPLTLAISAGEYGVLYVYLTATFLIFRPERGQQLEGWINVQSDGFLGAVVHNLFSVGIERKRLPADWRWVAPGEEKEEEADSDNANAKAKTTTTDDEDEDEDDEDGDSPIDPDQEHFQPLPASASAALDLGLGLSNHHSNNNNKAADPFADTADAATGYFQTGSGKKVRGTIRFRVRDVDVIPGAEVDKGFLSIEGTMLSAEEEARVVAEERRRAGYGQEQVVVMSGAVGGAGAEGEAEEVVEVDVEAEAPAPVKKSKEKKKKTKKGTS
ncbi:hypothetical protein FQN52_005013 [Onygenales sp. PD_12]|nr:hypothetical protein FQN52_005013 [Onygenales sp. PD_12]